MSGVSGGLANVVPITCGPNRKGASVGAEEDSARATCTGSSDSAEAGEADWFIGELASRLPKPNEFTSVLHEAVVVPKGNGLGSRRAQQNGRG